ncbi:MULTISPECIES: hypothetical protein [Streptomyces]|uniref:Integral membrane protein n=1 Tax=Streptomyces tricolor TaxID=68277 RepID=A0ABS9JQ89_9ACTN|nr:MULTISPECIES: hypothetical protein [Streptomyces]MCG0067738.1 hypothetical protein [Streptomyces tricolor]BCM67414.1 hypothetical protein EASAB2608_02748 [Streptomyces sp. EAS-AB2608]CUW29817.1 hypothetical protein TUE45_04528 [Streptomyces reticuli]
MIPAMPATATSARRASVTALRFGRVSMAGAFAALILFAGVWGSWGTAQHVMLVKGRETGTVEVTRCAGDTCTGPFTPTSAGARPRARVEIAHSVAVRTGATYDVVLKPGSGDAVRSGPAGILYAWLPLGGALLLAAVVVAGGMRLVRPAWVLGLSGAVLLTAAFVALQ